MLLLVELLNGDLYLVRPLLGSFVAELREGGGLRPAVFVLIIKLIENPKEIFALYFYNNSSATFKVFGVNPRCHFSDYITSQVTREPSLCRPTAEFLWLVTGSLLLIIYLTKP